MSPLKNRKRTKSATAPPNPAIIAISIADKVFDKLKRMNTPNGAVDAETYNMPAIKEPIIGILEILRIV